MEYKKTVLQRSLLEAKQLLQRLKVQESREGKTLCETITWLLLQSLLQRSQ